jgi:hypothetical protein
VKRSVGGSSQLTIVLPAMLVISGRTKRAASAGIELRLGLASTTKDRPAVLPSQLQLEHLVRELVFEHQRRPSPRGQPP